MIIASLKGGLGNQMFQYALGRNLSIKLGAPLFLDIDSYESNPGRSFSLNRFPIAAEIAGTRQKKLCRRISEKSFGFDADIVHAGDNIILDGYWQSEKYFLDISKIIRSDFELKEKAPRIDDIRRAIDESLSVSLHVRRGDYLSPKHAKVYVQCGADYFSRALAKVGESIPGKIRIFVFSDDPDWVKAHIRLPSSAETVSGRGFSDSEELFLMSRCKHNIIANSSFSWWGAWLNPNPDKIVIAPRKWFVDPSKDERDLIPPSWITL